MHCWDRLPVVRKTGGLADTVIDLDAAVDHPRVHPTGFTFEKYDARAFWKAIEHALKIYRKDKPLWQQIQINGMKKDFSWSRSANEYAAV